MRPFSKILAITLCLLIALSCFAQGGGGQRGRRGGRNNASLGALLRRTDVQTDLALTEDEKTKLTALQEAERAQYSQGGTRPTREEMQARQQEQEKKIEEVLTPEQFARLQQIQIQVEGIQAITRSAVQTKLGLSAEQVQQIKDLQKQYQEANASARQNSDPAAGRTAMQANMATLKSNLEKVLNADQTAKLEALKGKPFQADPPAQG